MNDTINDIRNRKCAVINDGSLPDLQTVLNYIFPDDECIPSGDALYYFAFYGNNKEWESSNDFPSDISNCELTSIIIEEIEKNN